jgi:uncharacterized protein (TIGR02300 family)
MHRPGKVVGHCARLLTAGFRYGKARDVSWSQHRLPTLFNLLGGVSLMIKPEWGHKRSCPKCGTRFYDLGKDDPVTCIECGAAWEPDPILKSKQPMPFDAPKKEVEKEKADTDLSEEDLDIDEDAEPSPDDDVDLGGDDDIGLKTGDDDEDH